MLVGILWLASRGLLEGSFEVSWRQFWSILEPLLGLLGPPDAPWDARWGFVGLPETLLGASGGLRGRLLGASWSFLGASWGGRLDFSLRGPPLGSLLGPSGGPLGPSWAALGPSWGFLGPSCLC